MAVPRSGSSRFRHRLHPFNGVTMLGIARRFSKIQRRKRAPRGALPSLVNGYDWKRAPRGALYVGAGKRELQDRYSIRVGVWNLYRVFVGAGEIVRRKHRVKLIVYFVK